MGVNYDTYDIHQSGGKWGSLTLRQKYSINFIHFYVKLGRLNCMIIFRILIRIRYLTYTVPDI